MEKRIANILPFMPRVPRQCRDIRDFSDSFLAGLLVETNGEIVRHLETCPDCRAELAWRRALRDRLRAAVTRAEELRPRPEFAAELAATLRPAPSAVSRRLLFQSWWAIAAGLILAAGGGTAVRESRARSRLAALAREAAGGHQNCAVRFSLGERPISLEEASRQYGNPYAALATFQVPAIDAGLVAIDRHACVYQGRRFGHVALRYEGALMSLLVTGGAAPSAPQLEPPDGAFEVASLPAGRFVGFIVADIDRRKVLRLAEALAVPLSRHLA